jgi:hypothetical protein
MIGRNDLCNTAVDCDATGVEDRRQCKKCDFMTKRKGKQEPIFKISAAGPRFRDFAVGYVAERGN